ncbi:hypothetical protein [Geomonas subterranea]|uniref:hypothetical protein n=1 Tax=Geomonas subterranea TaxID=2847989 RepID=UPI001CD7A840|nr:hypothetical protein [Geomonas fuzhouensis]
MSRPKTNPPSKSAQYLLPVELIEAIKENADRKTGGNQSFLVREILKGNMALDLEGK